MVEYSCMYSGFFQAHSKFHKYLNILYHHKHEEQYYASSTSIELQQLTTNTSKPGCWFMPGEFSDSANIHNKEMSNEIVKWKSSQDSADEQKRESLSEKIRLVQQRKRLSTASLMDKAFLSYHELAPALMAIASNKRSSMHSASVPQRIRDSFQARRCSKRVSQVITPGSKMSRMSTVSKDWELKLINGLLSDHDAEHTDSEEWRRFTVTGFFSNESLNLTLPEPAEIPLPPSPKPLTVQKISAKSCLRVVQAVQVSDEILDEFDYPSGSEVSEDEASDSEARSFVSSVVISPISVREVPEIKVEPENQSESESWPLPSNAIPTILSPTTPLPDPLRCNPPERTIHKTRSQHSLRSIRSNRSNRKAFIMQHNDASSVSVHSLGTTTTKSISDVESALDTETASRNARPKQRKFTTHMFGPLKRSNASRAMLGFSILTPVAETFEKARKGSAASIQSDADQANSKSTQSSTTGKKTSRFVFQGALVRRGSMRSSGRLQ